MLPRLRVSPLVSVGSGCVSGLAPVAVTVSCVALGDTLVSVKVPSATVVKLEPRALTVAPVTGLPVDNSRIVPFRVTDPPPPPPPPQAVRTAIHAAAISADSIRLDRFIQSISRSLANDRERLYGPGRFAFRRARDDVDEIDARRHRHAPLI